MIMDRSLRPAAVNHETRVPYIRWTEGLHKCKGHKVLCRDLRPAFPALFLHLAAITLQGLVCHSVMAAKFRKCSICRRQGRCSCNAHRLSNCQKAYQQASTGWRMNQRRGRTCFRLSRCLPLVFLPAY